MVNVAVIGAAGGIGQSLSLLLLRELPYGSTLSLYDVVGAAGVAADLSHVDRAGVTVKYASGKMPPVPRDTALAELACDVDIFVICAGVPRKPGMTRDDLFSVNAGIVLDLVLTCSISSPDACFCIVTNPVNSTVPIAAQALKKLGIYNKDKLFGVSLLDGIRATRFINNARSPYSVPSVPVVGGHSEVSIVPLFSQLPGPVLEETKLESIRKHVQVAGTEVVKAKNGCGSATLSMAEAGARFVMFLVKGLTGQDCPVVCAYVDTDGEGECDFFAIPVMLGKNGIEKRLSIGPVNCREETMLKEAADVVKSNITTGVEFARSKL